MKTKAEKKIFILLFIFFIITILIPFILFAQKEALKNGMLHFELEKFYKSLIKNEPLNLRHYIALADLYKKYGETEASLSIKKDGIDLMKKEINRNAVILKRAEYVYSKMCIQGQSVPICEITREENIFGSDTSEKYGGIYIKLKNEIDKVDYEKMFNITSGYENVSNDTFIHILFGDKYYSIKKYELALVEYEKALKMDGETNPYISAKIGNIFYFKGKYIEAEKYYEDSLAFDGNNQKVRFNLAKTYLNLSQNGKALSLFSDIIAQTANEQEDILYKSYVEAGGIYFSQTRYNQALSLYLKALGIKEDAHILIKIALTYEMLKNKTVAEYYFIKSLEYGESFEAYYNLGRLENEKANYESSSFFYQKALDIDKDNVATMIMLGETKMFLGDNENAKDIFRNAMKYDSKNPDIYSKLADIYLSEDDSEKAMDMLNLAIKNGEHSSHIYAMLGDIYSEKGDTENAIDYYEKALSIDEEDINIRYALGNLYMKNLEYLKAVGMFAYVIKEMPSFTEAHQKIEYIYTILNITQENTTAEKNISEKEKI